MADEQKDELINSMIAEAAEISGIPADDLTPGRAAEILNEAGVPPAGLDSITGLIEDLMTPALKESTDKLVHNASILFDTINGMQAGIQTEKVKTATAAVKDLIAAVGLTESMKATFADLKKQWEEFNAFREEFEKERPALQPYLNEELKKPEYEGVPLEELPLSYFRQAIENARAAKAIVEGSYKPTKANFPIDKLNYMLPEELFKQRGDGQLMFAQTFDMNKSGKNDGAYLTFSLLFNDEEADEQSRKMKLSKQISHFDMRIQGAISTGLDAGKDIFSINEIWRAMGRKGKPKANQKEKIVESISKMNRGFITIDNEEEATVYNYPHFVYEGHIMPSDKLTIYRNGQEEIYYRILRYPPLVEFAKQRQQLTVIPIKVLQSPGNKTDRVYQIEDYLLYRITRAKHDLADAKDKLQKKYTKANAAEVNKKKELVIVFDTLLERIGYIGKTAYYQQRDVIDPAEELLNYYASDEAGNFISAIKKKPARNPEKFIITLP